MNSSEFLRGQNDCKNGEPHKPNQSNDYDRGYAAQYELEAVTAALVGMINE